MKNLFAIILLASITLTHSACVTVARNGSDTKVGCGGVQLYEQTKR